MEREGRMVGWREGRMVGDDGGMEREERMERKERILQIIERNSVSKQD